MDTPMLKVLARRLRSFLAHHHLSINHGQALDLAASLAGLHKWAEVKSRPKGTSTDSLDAEVILRLAERIGSRHGKSFSVEALQAALEHPLALSAAQRLHTDSSVPSGDKGEKVLTYVEVGDTGAPTGRRASFANVEFQPLRYADLIGKKLGQKITIPLSWKNARVVDSSIPEITVEGFSSGNTTIESPYTAKTIGLVKGGWLPSGLALRDDTIVLPDRCTISEFQGRFHNGSKKREEDVDFLDLFAGERVRINPLLFALEGNLKRNPTSEVVEQQLEEACAKLRSALPLAELVPDGKSGLPGVVGIIQDMQVSMARKQDLLMRLAPKLQAPVSAKRKALLWGDVLTTARECGVPSNSLLVVAALSAIAVPNGRSPAKGVLKLRDQPYTAEVAYNALADLRALEVLMSLFALFPGQRIMLCTGDKDLALLWSGIRASDFAWADGHVSFKLSPVEDLLPGVSPEQLGAFLEMSE